MPTVIAAKELRYGGRTIYAGEQFEATAKDADLLKRIGKVGVATPNPTDVPKKAEPVDDEAVALRAEYTERFGKRPFNGWSPEQLRERMGYSRRDMRAED